MTDKSEMIFGVRAVIEAIQAGKEIDKILVKKDIQSDLSKELFAALKGLLIPVQRVPVERINRITRKNHQGVVAFISSVTYQKTEDLVPFLFEQGKNPFFVMLDGITDVRNFGAIARTCECAAVDAVIIPARGSVSVNADAMKTSAGALHTLPVCREQNLRATLQYLKDSGFRIVAATEKGDYDYTKADYTGPMCIKRKSAKGKIKSFFISVVVSLFHSFINQNTGSYGNIQRFDSSQHRYLHPFVTESQMII